MHCVLATAQGLAALGGVSANRWCSAFQQLRLKTAVQERLRRQLAAPADSSAEEDGSGAQALAKHDEQADEDEYEEAEEYEEMEVEDEDMDDDSDASGAAARATDSYDGGDGAGRLYSDFADGSARSPEPQVGFCRT